MRNTFWRSLAAAGALLAACTARAGDTPPGTAGNPMRPGTKPHPEVGGVAGRHPEPAAPAAKGKPAPAPAYSTHLAAPHSPGTTTPGKPAISPGNKPAVTPGHTGVAGSAGATPTHLPSAHPSPLGQAATPLEHGSLKTTAPTPFSAARQPGTPTAALGGAVSHLNYHPGVLNGTGWRKSP